jgi:two-component system phosphate regulon sensor histidine kinase PhoR
MNKKLLWILALFIGISMIALIAVQYYWISKSIHLKERQFSEQVNALLAYLSKEIEREEAQNYILNQLQKPSLKDTFATTRNHYRFDTIIQSGDQYLSYHQNITFFGDNQQQGSYEMYTITGNDTFTALTEKPKSVYDSFNNHSRYRSALSASMQSQYQNRRQFIDDIVDRMFLFEKDVSERIAPEQLENIIHNMLSENGYNLNFEFAVTRNFNEIAFKSKSFERNENLDYYKVRLFPGDFFSSNNFLYIYFPRKQSFLIKNMGFMATSSAFLTMVVVVSFILSILIIFRQKKLSEIKSDFISNMTHELKTPISTISLATQMLGDKSIPVELKDIDKISGVISEESQRLGYQVERVLQMALFEKGKLKLNKKEIDLHEIIDSATRNFSLQIKNKNGTLNNQLDATNTILFADQVHITNIVSNLLDNAVKYTPQEPNITVRTGSKNGMLHLSVKDNGIGISKENQRKIFDKFYRVPNGNLHDTKGFGLGLSYVKMIVEAHKGNIEINSELKKGTEVIIKLPLKT